ncbi:DUF5959 family protein [Streptomyces nigra]|uniref:DUF5959 family protein n=1 Tax=Streptomyces nigra TaxID=1827580 RepID=UPI0030D47013
MPRHADRHTVTAPGKPADRGGRGLRLYLHPSDSGRLSLSVHDPDRLTVALGLEPPPQWIEEHEIRLRRMREVYGES